MVAQFNSARGGFRFDSLYHDKLSWKYVDGSIIKLLGSHLWRLIATAGFDQKFTVCETRLSMVSFRIRANFKEFILSDSMQMGPTQQTAPLWHRYCPTDPQRFYLNMLTNTA